MSVIISSYVYMCMSIYTRTYDMYLNITEKDLQTILRDDISYQWL